MLFSTATHTIVNKSTTKTTRVKSTQCTNQIKSIKSRLITVDDTSSNTISPDCEARVLVTTQTQRHVSPVTVNGEH